MLICKNIICVKLLQDPNIFAVAGVYDWCKGPEHTWLKSNIARSVVHPKFHDKDADDLRDGEDVQATIPLKKTRGAALLTPKNTKSYRLTPPVRFNTALKLERNFPSMIISVKAYLPEKIFRQISTSPFCS